MKSSHGAWSFASAVAAFAIANAALGEVRYVDPVGGDGSDGVTWETAYHTLGEALADFHAPQSEVTEIWVATGRVFPGDPDFVYTPSATNPAVSFEIQRAPLALYGGFVGGENSPAARLLNANRTVLSGNLGANGRSYRIMFVENDIEDVLVDGFDFEDGDGSQDGNERRGGALSTADTSPETGTWGTLELRHCRFRNNKGAFNGGAVCVHRRLVKLRDCEFTDNEGAEEGAGFPTDNGGAIAVLSGSIDAVNTLFENNRSGGFGVGGAVELTDSPAARFVNCAFIANIVKTGFNGLPGGAVWYGGDVGTTRPEFVNCLFSRNEAGLRGGGVFATTGAVVTQCTFCGNEVSTYGGGLASDAAGTSTITNSVFWGNIAPGAESLEEAQYGPLNESEAAEFVVGYSCVEAASAPAGTANINDDPLFVDSAKDDCRLDTGSPAIDGGDDASIPDDDLDVDDDAQFGETLPLDLDLRSRVFVTVDMGAYEAQCLGDLNADGKTDGADLGILLAQWGTCPECSGDLNGDGIVNGADLGLLLSAWGCDVYGSQSLIEGSGGLDSPSELAAVLGFGSVEEMVAWLVQQDFKSMVGVLDLLME